MAYAQTGVTYPNHPIRFIVPYAPGGNGDIVSRLLGQFLATPLKQQIVIDNRGGANGNIGAQLAARAPGDGYTIMLATNTHVINMTMYADPGYDVEKDFAPVSLITKASSVLVVTPNLPAQNVKELIALARGTPGQLNFGSGGSGSSSHLTTELFMMATGVQMRHVPYKAIVQALTDLIGGQVQIVFTSTSSALPYMQSGRLRALAITTTTRSTIVPNLPTVSESGVPGFDGSSWQCVLVPTRTPKNIIGRLNAEIVNVLKTDEAKEKFLAQGVEAVPSTPDQLGRYIHAETIKWAKVIKSSGAKVE